ncbi:HAD family phosphatase [Haloechinothrix sp. YIM 98757]|uniref:HAD family phosphatase n=1 Tax=Haloechinothrix aidingensis TaxID=2752311 RepID=A0A838A8B0_9PSEU|nr:HAD family phosphatase [Haloechinothrix aidingensis]MBA0125568.1 HAD family phosphatase [Haloechinothrix aidingensis]
MSPSTVGATGDSDHVILPYVHATVFDLGGVLLDWDPEYLYASLIPDEDERRYFLTEVCPREWNAELDVGRDWAEAIAERAERFPAYAELIAAYHRRWDEMIAGPIPGMVEVLDELRLAGVPLYVLSNISAAKWRDAVARWGFLDRLRGAVVSGQEGVVKPDPSIYRTLLERYELEPERTFFTDDLPGNVAAARAWGIDAEQFVDAATLRGQLVDRGLLRG